MENSIFSRIINESQNLTESKKKLHEDEGAELVVVDPDADFDDIKKAALDDDTVNAPSEIEKDPEDYIGQFVYKCPNCGCNHFEKDPLDLTESIECPECGEDITPQLIGKIVPVEAEATVDDEVVSEPDEAPEVDESDEDDEAPESDEDDEEFDESKYDQLMGKFLSENYKNIKSSKTTKVVHKSTGSLMIESLITYKSGKTATARMLTSNLDTKKNGKFCVRAVESKLFKTHGSKPFMIEGLIKDRKIRPTKMTYNFITESNHKKYQVSGTATLLK